MGLKLKQPKTSWSLEKVIGSIRDKEILALSRAFGYRGKNVTKAAEILDKNGWQAVPF